MRRAVLILLVSAMIFLSIVCTISPSALADLDPTITLEAPSEIEIDVSPGALSRATIRGNVTCTTTSIEDVLVRISADNSHGSVSISPYTLIFAKVGTETKQFKVNITIPLLTSSYEEPTVTINLTWSQGAQSGSEEPHVVHVVILPFSRLAIFSEMAVKEIVQGERTTFKMRFENTGNAYDTYSIEIENLEYLKDHGITVTSVSQVSIKEGHNKTMYVFVDTSSDTKSLRSYNINFNCTSSTSEEFYYEEYHLVLKVIPGIVQIITSPIALILIAIVIILLIIYFVKRKKTENPG
ncbi:MAG: hypothetical protein JSW00_17490 [Thermoplasmata archaeon]|nr:MAG: hypothetical protein JSW00_17490 [Thermoplasmata archaeon]